MHRLRNLRRAFLSFLMVGGTYLVYATCLAPFIESHPVSHEATGDIENPPLAPYSSDRFLQELSALFPEGSWELDRPQVLRSKQATLLLSDFEQEGDSLRIAKCSLVFYGSAGRSSTDARGPVILQAPEGAILDFDQPIDLSSGVVGRPVGGKLVGNIRIFSAGGPNSEDLEMTTRNVVITEGRIWTPEPVSFRLGTNYGSGEYLIIERGLGDTAKDDWLSGLGRIELQRLHRFTLHMADEGMFDAVGPSSPNPSTGHGATLELRCDGPLHFDLREMLATVDKNVRITRSRPGFPVDTVHANNLSLRLARVQPAATPTAPDPKPTLAVTRVVAVGSPLIIDARSMETYLESRRLEYNFESKRVLLQGEDPFQAGPSQQSGEVRLQSPQHTVTARQVEFSGTADPSTWQLEALGPGQYVGAPTAATQHRLAASWEDQLRLQPSPEGQVLRLGGKVSVRSPQMGAIHADELALWLRQEKQLVAQRIDGTAVEEQKVVPLRLETFARPGGSTQLNTPRLNGTLAKLTLHFVDPKLAPPPPARRTPAPVQGPVGRSTAPEETAPAAQYTVEGGSLAAWVVTEPAQLVRLRVRGRTRLRESSPAARPFELAGDSIDYEVSPGGIPSAHLQGSPAIVSSSQLRATGQSIRLLGQQNRLEIPGPGSLRLPVPRGEQTGQPAQLIDMDVRWQGGLQFDGQVADFQENIRVSADDLHIRTKHLQVSLREPIRLTQLEGGGPQPELHRIVAEGGMDVTNRSRDPSGQTSGYHRLVAQDFYLDYPSGDATARGPGWLAATSWGRNTPGPMGMSQEKPDESDSDQKMQLSVAFSRGLQANLHQRTCQLSDDVRCWYGPVNEWEDRVDPVHTTQLGARELKMTCRELLVMESPSARAAPGRKPVELFANGDTYVESQRYAAKGNQIKYAEANDMLTLEGDDQRPAELWQRHLASGKSSHSGRARTIRYWPQSGQLEVKFLSLDLSQRPQPRQ